jgi:UDP-galactopyranose mutase
MTTSEYDYLIVGAGFFGSICAYELTKLGKKCLILEKRNHIGGNCFTEKRDNINIHIYGPHIFHTSNQEVWDWMNKFTEFNNFRLSPVANYKGEIYSLPFSMWTFSKMWNITTPEQARKIIQSQSLTNESPKNLEEQALSLVGKDIYYKLIKGYTEKQWRKPATELPKEIIKRLPVRFTYDNNYFNDKYQGIPIGGYTKIFEKLLDGIEVRLGVDYLENHQWWNSQAKKIIYTGPIDSYFSWDLGELEYKTTKFNHQKVPMNNFQGAPVVNYTDIETSYTRIIEHKHFESSISDVSWITYEYPEEYTREKDPYYPVNDHYNNNLYKKYKERGDREGIYFGGRLAEYKYYDMDKVILSALEMVKKISSESYF